MATKKTNTPKRVFPAPLPEGFKPEDFDWQSRVKRDKVPDGFVSFELWYVDKMGWVFPTLMIRNASRNRGLGQSQAPRTYAVTLEGKLIACGRGPHVKGTYQVWVNNRNFKKLQKYHVLISEGSIKANEYRDALSTSRMNSRLRRAGW